MNDKIVDMKDRIVGIAESYIAVLKPSNKLVLIPVQKRQGFLYPDTANTSELQFFEDRVTCSYPGGFSIGDF